MSSTRRAEPGEPTDESSFTERTARVWSELLGASGTSHSEQLPTNRHTDRPANRPIHRPEHRPIAAVLGCSDARVSPSFVFQQPAGALFEVRVAGNTLGPAVVSSLDYAVAHAGVEVVVVLGHSHCGAVAAALRQCADGDDVRSGATVDGLQAIVDPVMSLIEADPTSDATTVTHRNVRHVAAELAAHFGAAGRQVAVVGAVYDLEAATVRRVAL